MPLIFKKSFLYLFHPPPYTMDFFKLKNNFIIFFIFLIFFNERIFSQCIDYFDAIDHEVKRNVACPLVTDDPSKYSRRTTSSYEDESKIQIVDFKCNNATEEICNKVRDTFFVAGKIISETFILKSPILLSVNYTNICMVQPELCNLRGEIVIIGNSQYIYTHILINILYIKCKFIKFL
jgi:hypothetical protein